MECVVSGTNLTGHFWLANFAYHSRCRCLSHLELVAGRYFSFSMVYWSEQIQSIVRAEHDYSEQDPIQSISLCHSQSLRCTGFSCPDQLVQFGGLHLAIRAWGVGAVPIFCSEMCDSWLYVSMCFHDCGLLMCFIITVYALVIHILKLKKYFMVSYKYTRRSVFP